MDLFTELLIQRIQIVTNPNLSRDVAEEAYRAFESSIESAEQVGATDASLDAIRDELNRVRNSLNSILSRQREQNSEWVERREEYLESDLQRQLNRLESNLQRAIAALKLISRIDALLESLRLPKDIEQSQFESNQLITSAPERAIINDYLGMDVRDFDRLTPEVHIWFLERILKNEPSNLTQNLSRLVKVYFEVPVGIVRYLILQTLCAASNRDSYYLRNIANRIHEEHQNTVEKIGLLYQLTDVLIDISSSESLQALRDIVSDEKHRDSSHVTNRIRQRLEKLRRGSDLNSDSQDGNYLREFLIT